MAPKSSPEKSKSAQNRRLLKKLNKVIRLCSNLSDEVQTLKLMEKKRKKQMKKLKRGIDRLPHDLVEELRNIKPPAPAAQPHADSSSAQRRRLQLSFVCKLPTKLFTANSIYAIDDGTKTNVPVRVVLVDEQHSVVSEGPLSSLKIEIFVAYGDFKAEDSQDWTTKEAETSRLPARKDKGPLLLGSCGGTMEKGSCTFNDLKFGDNSSWVPSKTFRLVANVAEGARMADMVDIRPAISEPFAVKDQRGKQYEKHSVPSRDDEVWRIRRIGKDGPYHKRLEDKGVRTVEDFLQRYYMDQSSLRKILGAKDGAWATIVEHAKECNLNNDGFQYESPESKVKLLFDCFYKLEWVSFDGQSYQRFHDLAEDDKSRVEQLRLRAFEDQTKLVQIKSLSEIITAKTNQDILVPDPNPQHPVDPNPHHAEKKFLLEDAGVQQEAIWKDIDASTMEIDEYQQDHAVADPPPYQGGCQTFAESSAATYSGLHQSSAPKLPPAANAHSLSFVGNSSLPTDSNQSMYLSDSFGNEAFPSHSGFEPLIPEGYYQNLPGFPKTPVFSEEELPQQEQTLTQSNAAGIEDLCPIASGSFLTDTELIIDYFSGR